ncbi:MAG TPA: endonuclease/exonuclease/phosphatase family protein [Oligoflexus sp.]|uniref:endonuclease/exonuclease/phosphatase family protein n=1 Tax=Oligoflexus sp. TaxID=1971216 RepID=UPI002D68043E|nr:endonuclease/exonuclease/phosphatase family protein [Oligoflexus sp.]HYX37190.1 endonuclease/exonuclease/phosphatase family protein [Oligoflexus sp.]
MRLCACLFPLVLISPSLFGQSSHERTLKFMTYNVAGLPEPISSSSPARNTAKIGELINSYDVVLVQEDFNYHHLLTGTAQHPYQSKTSGWAVFGDGLNIFSNVPFTHVERVKWKNCHGVITDGSDCLTPKGIMLAQYEIAPGVVVDIYNLHADAGSDEKSLDARRRNITQLLGLIHTGSQGKPVIIVGDFNSRYTRNGDIAEQIIEAGFQDSWMVTHGLTTVPAKGGALNESCATEPSSATCELIDKIYFRNGPNLQISVVDYSVPFDIFRDDAGQPLSDHNPVAAELKFHWNQP